MDEATFSQFSYDNTSAGSVLASGGTGGGATGSLHSSNSLPIQTE